MAVANCPPITATEKLKLGDGPYTASRQPSAKEETRYFKLILCPLKSACHINKVISLLSIHHQPGLELITQHPFGWQELSRETFLI